MSELLRAADQAAKAGECLNVRLEGPSDLLARPDAGAAPPAPAPAAARAYPDVTRGARALDSAAAAAKAASGGACLLPGPPCTRFADPPACTVQTPPLFLANGRHPSRCMSTRRPSLWTTPTRKTYRAGAVARGTRSDVFLFHAPHITTGRCCWSTSSAMVRRIPPRGEAFFLADVLLWCLLQSYRSREPRSAAVRLGVVRAPWFCPSRTRRRGRLSPTRSTRACGHLRRATAWP